MLYLYDAGEFKIFFTYIHVNFLELIKPAAYI